MLQQATTSSPTSLCQFCEWISIFFSGSKKHGRFVTSLRVKRIGKCWLKLLPDSLILILV